MPPDWSSVIHEEERERATRPAPPERDLAAPERPALGNQAAAGLADLDAAHSVSDPSDRWEREAESIASTLSSKLAPEADAGAPSDRLPPSIVDVVRSELGADVSRVPVSHAPEEASAIGAKAFTLGGAITTGAGAAGAHSAAGRETLLHEAVHAVQQGAAPMTAPAAMSVTPAPAGVAQRVTGPGGGARSTSRGVDRIVHDWVAKPATFAVLVEFAGKEISAEGPLFYGAIEVYKRAPSVARARNIFNYFIDTDGPGTVNVGYAIRKHLIDIFNDPTRTGEIDANVFDEIQVEQLRQLQDTVTRMQRTALFERLESWVGKASYKLVDPFSLSQRRQAITRGHLYQRWILNIVNGAETRDAMVLSDIAGARLATVFESGAMSRDAGRWKASSSVASKIWGSLRHEWSGG